MSTLVCRQERSPAADFGYSSSQSGTQAVTASQAERVLPVQESPRTTTMPAPALATVCKWLRSSPSWSRSM
ncbi:hypothetical protein [Streptomyces mirabilis]|uniref:hypothetical protein n=1 Tax=Streptomyces mirabilis TaxID=68239 RepID=UPI0033B88535